MNVPPYETIPYEAGPLGPRLASRALKICADHPILADYPVTLWHDAAYQLHCDPQRLADAALRTCDVVAFRHPHRDRIEDEAAVIARLGYMPADVLEAQIATYRAAGWTTQTAITSTGFCLRRRTPLVEAWQAAWWQEVATWGWRDQMSVDYALWKTGLSVTYIPGHYRDNPHARWFNTDAARQWALRFQSRPPRPPVQLPHGALPPVAVPRRGRSSG
jgi:hypothetical protein